MYHVFIIHSSAHEASRLVPLDYFFFFFLRFWHRVRRNSAKLELCQKVAHKSNQAQVLAVF